MKRESVYPYTITDPPGVNIHRLREMVDDGRGISLRELGDACRPALDHTTVRRLENNQGYTQDSLERIANAFSRLLGFSVTVPDLFLPSQLAAWAELPDTARSRVAEVVRDAADAAHYRRRP